MVRYSVTVHSKTLQPPFRLQNSSTTQILYYPLDLLRILHRLGNTNIPTTEELEKIRTDLYQWKLNTFNISKIAIVN